jgi:hypothetical protein
MSNWEIIIALIGYSFLLISITSLVVYFMSKE